MAIVTLTESAAATARELLERDGHQRFALRLVVSHERCSGLRYPPRFDEHV